MIQKTRFSSTSLIASIWFVLLIFCIGCGEDKKSKAVEKPEVSKIKEESNKLKVIFDTDANNELDDQHALAYLLFNDDFFETVGVTVNATKSGGEVQNHYDEALRILKLCNKEAEIALVNGANESFANIQGDINKTEYDGHESVNFILNESKKHSLVIVAVGKLTNIALALMKDPSLADRTKIIWLGSNYPNPGEYNQENDTIAMNYVLKSSIPFEMVTVRYGEATGTDAVSVTMGEINDHMPGKGPVANKPVVGRHGGNFSSFGDYSVSLFENIEAHDDDNYSRPLFDMVAVAILKDENWGEKRQMPAPVLIDGKWVERPNNARKIDLWENFDRDALINEFFVTIDRVTPKNKQQ